MVSFSNTPGRICMIDEKEFLFFSGYSYLGMNHVKKLTDQVKEGIDKYGVLFPSSRISNTRLKLYDEFENYLSELTTTEETVSFSSGYLAGKTITDILSSYTNIFVAPHSHPAIIINGIKLYSENFDDWKGEITTLINSSNENEFVLISDSINILESIINNFSFLQNISSDKKIIFLIDDSHGIGVLGNDGEGIISQLPKLLNVEYILCYSLSKAFNIEGGAVSCSKYFGKQLREHPNYAGSTAINPSLIHGFLNSKKLYAEQRKKLFENISHLKKNIKSTTYLKNDFDLPVFVCEAERAEELFYKNNIIISSFSYPTIHSKKINRVVVNALHTKNDLDKLCTAW